MTERLDGYLHEPGQPLTYERLIQMLDYLVPARTFIAFNPHVDRDRGYRLAGLNPDVTVIVLHPSWQKFVTVSIESGAIRARLYQAPEVTPPTASPWYRDIHGYIAGSKKAPQVIIIAVLTVAVVAVIIVSIAKGWIV